VSGNARRYGLVPLLFFVSGAVGIGCEIAWSRELTLLFGASQRATGVLLAAFMAGLAIGAELGAGAADRLRRPALGYAAAELTIGVFALVSRPLFALARDAALAWPSAARVALAFALLVTPTCAMGASLPFLAAVVVRARAELRRGLAGLYAVNVAGGVAGALLTGFVLLPRAGMTATLGGCGIVAIAVAATAAASARPVSPAVVAALPAAAARLAVALATLVGLLSFALQVTWNRVFALLFGSSAYTFTSVLAVILAGLATGGLRELARPDDAPPWRTISGALVALAIAIYLGILAIGVAPAYLARASAPARTALLLVVVGPPSYLVGGLFPALAAQFPARRIGRAAGHALVATTVGNLAGALGAAFVFIPRLGAQRTLAALAGLALLVAVAAAIRAGRERLVGTSVAALLAAAAAALLGPSWDRVGLSAGTYRAALYRQIEDRRDDAPCGPRRRFPDSRVLYYREGELGTVAVLAHPAGPDCTLYSLRVNGKAEGSVFVAAPLAPRLAPGTPRLDVGDGPTQVLAGALPARAGAPPERALIVGWGTGTSLRALLDGGAGHAIAVEIEPAVVAAARIFDADLADDPRVELVLDDARVVLARLPPASLDAIVSQPSNPWVVGAAALFSREYFQLLRSRLRAGGRALVWAQLYEIDRESLRSLAATFVSVFPTAWAFRPPGSSDLLLLGTLDGGAPPIPPLADGAALARWSAGAPLTTDDNGLIEFRVADRLLAGAATPVAELLRGL
jgi:spermidine synthase